MSYSYVVTAQKPTSVTHSLTGAFTGPEDNNLILIKSTRLEVHVMGPEGLAPVLDVRIYGRVATAHMLRLPNETQDVLFLSTERLQFTILAYDAASGEIKTRSNGSLKECVGKLVDNEHILAADPLSRMIGLNVYATQFRVIPFSPQGRILEPFTVRLEENNIVDIKFLHGCSRPTIAVLYEDSREARHVKTYVINAREQEAAAGPWSQCNVEKGSNMLIPVPAPLGGVLIVGAQTLTYHSGASYKAVPIHTTTMAAYGRVDDNGSRYLLGDTQGQLFLLVLNNDGRQVQSLHLEVLGETTCPSSISYLDNGMVFVGSKAGDSQLIRLSTERDENGSYVKVEASYLNLGPIIDMCLLDLDRQGQGQLVTCSGTYKDGSLRVVRNGIGINEQAAIELPGIKGMWSLRASSAASHDKFLVQSFISETRVLGIEGEEMEEFQLPGFVAGKTLHCGNMAADLILQVTESCARLVSCQTLEAVSDWAVPQGSRITVASSNETQVVLALTGGELVHLALNTTQRALEQRARTQLDQEVSCISVNPLEPHTAGKPDASAPAPMEEDSAQRQARSSDVVAVGMWNDMTVRLLALPTLEPLVRCELGGDVQARSVLLVTLKATDYMLVGLGDGHLISCTVERAADAQGQWDAQGPLALGPRKKVTLGTQPIALSPFSSQGNTCVFASSDRPTVVYSSGSKLLFSNVNMPEVTLMTPFHSELFPECLALASESGLLIGTIDEIQKLQIQTIPLGESPRRIAHHAQGRVFGVCTAKYEGGEGDDEEHNRVRFLDDTTFESIYQYELRPFELAMSIASCSFSRDPRELLVVGTALAHDDDDEPKEGRILLFGVSTDASGAREVTLVSEKSTKGAVYCLNAFQGKLLAGIASKVQLYKWADKDGTPELQTEVGHHGHILALYMQSRGDFIVVGDLMRSISLLVYKSVESTIEEVAKDYNPNWMTAVGMIDDDTYIGAEQEYNLFTVRRYVEAATEEERFRLQASGEFHLGEFVNKFVRGSLVMQPTESDSGMSTPADAMAVDAAAAASEAQQDGQDKPAASAVSSSILFGGVFGMIGVIAPITEEDYRFFLCLQKALNKVVKGVGGLLHEDWRRFTTDQRTSDAHAFVDGDLVESFLDLAKDKMEEVVKLMQADGWTAPAAPERAEGVDVPAGAKQGGAPLTVEDVYKRVEDMSRIH